MAGTKITAEILRIVYPERSEWAQDYKPIIFSHFQRVGVRMSGRGLESHNRGAGLRPAARRADPLARPAPAEENGSAVHPLPQGGEGGVQTRGRGPECGRRAPPLDSSTRRSANYQKR
jgi:hypothetical protein